MRVAVLLIILWPMSALGNMHEVVDDAGVSWRVGARQFFNLVPDTDIVWYQDGVEMGTVNEAADGREDSDSVIELHPLTRRPAVAWESDGDILLSQWGGVDWVKPVLVADGPDIQINPSLAFDLPTVSKFVAYFEASATGQAIVILGGGLLVPDFDAEKRYGVMSAISRPEFMRFGGRLFVEWIDGMKVWGAVLLSDGTWSEAYRQADAMP